MEAGRVDVDQRSPPGEEEEGPAELAPGPLRGRLCGAHRRDRPPPHRPARGDRSGARSARVAVLQGQDPDRAHERGVRLPRLPHQWKRKRGSNKWYVYTFIADRPFRSVKAKIRALTPRTSQRELRALLIRINQITRGWTNYFKHAIAQRTFSKLQHHTWWRIVRMMRTRHRWKWTDVRRWLTDHTGRWHPISADGIDLFNPETIPITRYRYRGNQIPTPWAPAA